MATLLQQYKWLQDAVDRYEIKNRAAAAAINAARAVLVEDIATPNHALRVKWAAWAFGNLEAAGLEMLPFLVADPTVAQARDAATDNDIQAVVNVAVAAVCQRFAT